MYQIGTMKKIYSLLLILFAGDIVNGQSNLPCIPCLPQGITFTTQSQIDSFQINYPNCTQVEGNLRISGNDITNLNGLSGLTSIGGNFFILSCHNLSSLTGLNNVNSIGGDFILSDNESLTSMSGLDTLSSIGGYLSLDYNIGLTSLTGLDNLVSIGEDCFISFCFSLTNLTGLGSLNSIGGGLYISSDTSLVSLLGMDSLTTFGNLLISYCNALTCMDGLNYISSITGAIELYGNNSLSNLAGLENLYSIGGWLYVNSNPVLNSLSGLTNVNSIGQIFICSNNSLTNIIDLMNVNSTGGNLVICDNNNLTSLSGLDNIEPNSIVSLTISYNAVLSSCAVAGICEYLASPNCIVDISNNDTGCSTVEEVKDSCGITSVSYLNPESLLNIYPNPAIDNITLETTSKGSLSIHNISGQLLIQHEITEQTTTVDVSGLKSGVYLVKVVGTNSTQVGKVIKQ